MKRRTRLCFATLLTTVALAALVPALPASAAVNCTIAGTMTVNPGLLNMVAVNMGPQIQVLVGAPNNVHTFTITGTSSCVHVRTSPPSLDTSKNLLPANGVLKGFCGKFSGIGTFANGTLFAFVVAGMKMTVTGHATGELTVVVDPTIANNNCAHGAPATPLPAPGALTFIIGGAIKLLNCTPDLQPLVPGTPGDTETLTRIADTSVLIATVHVWVNLGTHTYSNHTCMPQAL